MNIKNKFMFRMLLGFTLGLVIGVVTYLIFIPEGTVLDKSFLISHLIGSTTIGLVGYGGAIVYDIESWSLGRATFTHYVVSFVTLFALSESLGWFPHDTLLIMFLAFSAAYVLIWITEYLSWRAQIRRINRDLELMLKKPDKTDIN